MGPLVADRGAVGTTSLAAPYAEIPLQIAAVFRYYL